MSTYSTCCQRDNSTVHKTNEAFNEGYYNYVNNPLSVLRPDSLCVGPDSRVGGLCSNYGALRQTVAGKDPSRPLYFHRLSLSSGCPANEITNENEVWDNTQTLSPEQQLVLNRGLGLAGYETRNWQVNSQLFDSSILADYRTKPNRRNTGFQGFWAMQGMGQPTRQMNTCEIGSRFRETKGEGPSKASYGSYGVRAGSLPM
jgi:hypothetical protein